MLLTEPLLEWFEWLQGSSSVGQLCSLLYTAALDFLVKTASSSMGPALVGWQSVLSLRDVLNNNGGEVRAHLEVSVDQFDWNRSFEEKSESIWNAG